MDPKESLLGGHSLIPYESHQSEKHQFDPMSLQPFPFEHLWVAARLETEGAGGFGFASAPFGERLPPRCLRRAHEMQRQTSLPKEELSQSMLSNPPSSYTIRAEKGTHHVGLPVESTRSLVYSRR